MPAGSTGPVDVRDNMVVLPACKSKTPEESAAEIDEKTKLVLNEQRGIIQKYLQRKSRVSGVKKLRKNKSRRKNKSKRKF